MIFDFFHYLFLAHFCCFFLFFFIIFCCLWVAACGNVKLLLPRKCWHFQFECKSHGLKSSNIELSVESITRQSARLPLCIHMASVSICARMYVCVDFVIVVCKSCLTTRYEFVEYEARNMVADTVVFIVPLIEYANAFSHVRPVSRQRQTATATKSWKQARWRRRTTQKTFYLGGPCRYVDRYPERWEMPSANSVTGTSCTHTWGCLFLTYSRHGLAGDNGQLPWHI